MKRLLLLAILLMSVTWCFGQKKHALTFIADSGYQWQFSISNKLTPIDTLYSSSENKAFQTIRYKYQEGKKLMQIKVTMFYNGKYWDFRSCEVKPFEQQFFINSGTFNMLNPGFQNAPYIQPHFFEPDTLTIKPN